MKISGFTIIKNAIINDYPVVEAITSILPVVDEMIVLAGDSEDDTRQLIEAIKSDKIKIFDSVWDKALRSGGEALAVETNKAFQLVDPASDWAFYIQADEVVHEKYHNAILESCRQHKDNMRVEGLLFKYLHFYGTYDYVGDSRKWYSHEVRILRNDKSISAYRDAQGFRRSEKRLKVKRANAFVYHYGWVKSPMQMQRKMKEVGQYWMPEEHWKNFLESDHVFDFDDCESVKKFTGTHPEVMEERVKEQSWNVKLNMKQKKFSLPDKLLYAFEKLTGIRLFEFKNYRII